MSRLDALLAGIGLGLLVSALVTKFIDVTWLLVSLGVLLMIVAGTGVISKRQPR